MTELVVHPGLVLIVGAPAAAAAARRAAQRRDARRCRWSRWSLVWQVPDGAAWQLRFLGLHARRRSQGDKLSRLFATVFALMAFGGGLFALNQTQPRRTCRRPSSMPARAIGVVLAGDLSRCSSSGS